MFSEEPPNYKIKPPKMGCDFPLSKRGIKEPFPNKSFSMLLVGAPGSGKTSFLVSILNQKGANRVYRKVFRNIMVVSPSISSLPEGLLEGIPDNQLFTDFSDELTEMIDANNETYLEKPEKNYSQLLILDDVAALLKLKANVVFLNKMFFNRRHKRLSIILTSQYIYQIPKSVRANVSDIVMFKPTVSEIETIRKEFVPMKKDKFMDFLKFVFRDPHDTLYINDRRELFRNLGRIIDKEDIMNEPAKEEAEKSGDEKK